MYDSFLQSDGPLILAVGGENKQIGKSLISTNLAIQFAQAGLHVILIDHDLGFASMQTLCDIDRDNKPHSVSDPRSKLENFLREEGIPNLLTIPGTIFGFDSAGFDADLRNKFFKKIKEISSADVVIIDLGDSSEISLDLFLMAHAGLIVTTADPASFIGTYEFIKNAIYRTIYRIFRGQGDLQKIVYEALFNRQNTAAVSIPELAEAIAQVSPWAAEVMLAICEDFNFYLVINQARHVEDAELGVKMHDFCLKKLGVEINFAGMLFFDNTIPEYSSEVAPLSISHPNSFAIKGIHRIAEVILRDTALAATHAEKRIFSTEWADAAAFVKKQSP